MTNRAFPDRPVEWAARVRRSTIRLLYERDARGLVDEELIDEAAFGFYARCRSILDATRAWQDGVVTCMNCRGELSHHYDASEVLRCGECGWETTWLAYRLSFRGKQLLAGHAGPWFVEYLERLPQARTAR